MATLEKSAIIATKSNNGDLVIMYPVTTTESVEGLSEQYASKAHEHSTVNGYTVESNVPSDAKFTDTICTWEEFTPIE